MLARGWIDRPQYEALRVLSEFGVHVKSLRLEAGRRGIDALTEEVALSAGEACELFLMQPMEVEIVERARPETLAALRREIRADFPFAPARGRALGADARSRRRRRRLAPRRAGGIVGRRRRIRLRRAPSPDARSRRRHSFPESPRMGFTVFVPRRPA